MCPLLDNILNFGHMSKLIGREVTRETYKDEADVDEIIKSLPSAAIMIKGCRNRNPDSLKPMDTHPRKTCMDKYLTAFTYITNNRACFAYYQEKSVPPVSDHSIIFSYHEPSVKRSIILNEPYWINSPDFLVFNVPFGAAPLKFMAKAARGHLRKGRDKRFGIRTQLVSVIVTAIN